MTVHFRINHIVLACLALLSFSVLAHAQTPVIFADPGMEAAVRAALNLPAGPVTDTALAAITTLDASRRGIVDLADLQYMPALETLNLSHNAVRSLTPLESLTKLDWLSVAYNQLRTVSGIYASAPLTHLEVDYNHLDGVQGMENLQSLQWLSLSHNRISTLQGLHSALAYTLTEADLSHNRLSSLAGLNAMVFLQKVNASYNCLQSLAELGTLTNLLWLSVAGNGLTSLTTLPSMPSLLEMDVSCNNLTTLSDIAGQPMLFALEARYNLLQNLSMGNPPPMLMYLGVSSNALTTLTGLDTFPNLTHLDVSFNLLTSLAGFPDYSGISTLIARGNQITGAGSLRRATSLKTLDLAANQIGSLNNLGAIAGLYVNMIDLSYNQIASLDDVIGGPPLRVQDLDLSYNQIVSISSAAVTTAIYLRKLDVSSNLLASVSGLAAAEKLYSLDISNNQVTDISPLGDREWNGLGLANNPTGNVQTILFKNGKCPKERISIGPGQLPNLAPFQNASYKLAELYATGSEYSNISPLTGLGLTSLRVENAGMYYTTRVAELQKAAPLSMLGLRGNNIADLSGLIGLQDASYIDVSNNPAQALQPLIDREPSGSLKAKSHFFPQSFLFPTTGTLDFAPPYLQEYALERFGLSPEEAHRRIAPEPVVDITGMPAATTAQAGLLSGMGARVITDGMGVYCSTGCLPAESMVPDLIGMPLDTAQAAVLAAGLTIADIAMICSDAIPLNITLSQDPSAGTFVAQGSGVAFTVSSGPCTVMVAVPDVTGMTQDAAAAALQAAGLQLGVVTQQCDNTVPDGSVISQDPIAGTQLLQGSSVVLAVSSGPCLVQVLVPDVSGLTTTAAEAALTAEGLMVGIVTEQYNDMVIAGLVLGQQPHAGISVLQGSAVSLIVSLGPAPVEGEGEGEVFVEGEGEPHAFLVERALNLYNGFSAADTNEDGLLSLQEAQTAEPGLTAAQFAELDTNGDGGLSEEELGQYLGLNLPGGGCGAGASGLLYALIALGALIFGFLGLTNLDQ